ncbi:MAG: membrane protein [Bacteroidia bacterium]|nr:MAG: membrane protein [Bacteroidia bacterium]
MSWETIIAFLKELTHPQSIIHYGGLSLLVLVVFAETGIMIGFFLPGDSLLFTAGLLTATGVLDYSIITVLLSVTTAAILGDSFGFYVGKKMGQALFKKKASLLFKPEYVTLTKQFYDKHGGKALVLGRFLPIIRTFAPILAGVVNLEYKKFIFYNVTGGILWVFSLILIGYFLGVWVPNIKEYLEYIIIFLIIVTTIPVVRTFLKERAEAQKRKKLQDEELEI